jgi:hypothetical protein
MKNLLRSCGIVYLIMWTAHLAIGTAMLRGFFGDGALAFLIHLSQSYIFNTDSQWVHLFTVGFPRDAQLLLNALGLQAALAGHINDPQTFKYIFVFWQFALPGFLYLSLLGILWRTGNMVWAIFPLISWAILSVPVDWNAVNSTRWAMPIFWMHFLLVLLAQQKPKPLTILAAGILGLSMWGGLYESVVAQFGLTVFIGGIIWWREKNITPLLVGFASLPGAVRAFLTLTAGGHAAPNAFRGLALPQMLTEPYAQFILGGLAILFLLGFASRYTPKIVYTVLLTLLCGVGLTIFFNPLPNVWLQTEMRFDYVIGSLGLMALAGLLRLLKQPPRENTIQAATVTLLIGSVLWFVQIQQSFAWQDCQTDYQTNKPRTPVILDPYNESLAAPDAKIGIVDRSRYGQCLWDWATPWADMLLKQDGKISQWSVLSFWQDFRFVEKDGKIFMHTNNWSLTTPTFQPDQMDLPLKTPLYDLTPLYQHTGLGPLFTRVHCKDPETSGSYWYTYLMSLSDDDRRLLYVCPRSP